MKSKNNGYFWALLAGFVFVSFLFCKTTTADMIDVKKNVYLPVVAICPAGSCIGGDGGEALSIGRTTVHLPENDAPMLPRDTFQELYYRATGQNGSIKGWKNQEKQRCPEGCEVKFSGPGSSVHIMPLNLVPGSCTNAGKSIEIPATVNTSLAFSNISCAEAEAAALEQLRQNEGNRIPSNLCSGSCSAEIEMSDFEAGCEKVGSSFKYVISHKLKMTCRDKIDFMWGEYEATTPYKMCSEFYTTGKDPKQIPNDYKKPTQTTTASSK